MHHPSVTEGAWPTEALAITEAGRAVLAKLRRAASPRRRLERASPATPSLAPRAKHSTDVGETKSRRRSGLNSDDDKRVVFRRDGERYIVFLDDDRIGFVRRADNGNWNFVDSTMAHSGYTKTRQRAGQLLRRRFEQMVRQGEI